MAPLTTASGRQVVVFELQGETYAVGIQHVQEIIRYTLPRTVSGTDPAIRGVINLRGKIIPVIDMKMRLAIDGVIDTETAKIVVVETSVGVAGIIVDEVAEVLTLDASALDVVPDFAHHASYVDGVAKVGDRLILLLEPDSLFAIELGASYAAAA
jgi:purine-binding chemotaxis protein CheW